MLYAVHIGAFPAAEITHMYNIKHRNHTWTDERKIWRPTVGLDGSYSATCMDSHAHSQGEYSPGGAAKMQQVRTPF